MKKVMSLILAALFGFSLAVVPATFTSCSTVAPYVQSAQAWLNDPKNQALIQEIAQAANILIGALATKPSAANENVVVGKLSRSYPNVPAGALRQIAANPAAYVRH